VIIVFLNPSGELGGAETALLDLMAAVREARPAWTLGLVASAGGPLLTRASAMGVSAAALTFPPSLARLGEWGSRGGLLSRVRFAAGACGAAMPAVAYVSRLKRHLIELQPTIVHTNGLKMHLLGARAAPAAAKLVWHVHDYPDTRPLAAALLSALSGRCSAVLANSESVAARTRDLLGPGVPVHTLYNSIDLERFQSTGPRLDLDALAGLAPLAPGGIRVGLLATFARWKGHNVFLEALSLLRTSVPVRGYVIGEPIYETRASQFSLSELRDMAASRGLGDGIGFTGRVDDVPAAMRALDIVVHASVEPEPFGLVIAEAMACGRSVIVSAAGGAAEIAEGVGMFHRPGNAVELADRLAELVGDRELRESLGEAGRAAALRLFSRRRLSDTLVPIYESLESSARS
jgi:glycosyltransferase involved in cell wall biosynthesis